jgi:hypothetical protein
MPARKVSRSSTTAHGCSANARRHIAMRSAADAAGAPVTQRSLAGRDDANLVEAEPAAAATAAATCPACGGSKVPPRMPMAAGMTHYVPTPSRWQPEAGLSPRPSAETLPPWRSPPDSSPGLRSDADRRGDRRQRPLPRPARRMRPRPRRPHQLVSFEEDPIPRSSRPSTPPTIARSRRQARADAQHPQGTRRRPGAITGQVTPRKPSRAWCPT